jgi:signal transduction histidine kinase
MDERFRSAGLREDRYTEAPRHAPKAALRLAHDFRNMLQLANSATRLVRREMAARSEHELAAMLDDTLDALDRANLLAQRLSGGASSESEPEDVLLQRIVPELRTLLSRALGDEVRLESLVAEDLPPLHCDRLELENVLLNLALNACQAMPNGGTLIIEALPCVDRNHLRCIKLSVTDTGHGMTEDVAEKAFEPFFSTRLLDGGSGLGLHNVQAFARKLGGNVRLLTKANEGTRVILHLPADPMYTLGRQSYPDEFE